jgi:hypothetical protein
MAGQGAADANPFRAFDFSLASHGHPHAFTRPRETGAPSVKQDGWQ